MNSRKIVKVFLASPGDLAEERKAARKVVDEFNLTWAERLGYQVELVGWEDTISSNKRPQAIINRELGQCELFYGIIWRRWGTPPALDGPYTSGFEEEFRLSQKRWKESGKPEIKLCFKEIDAEFLRDVGPELAKVIGFKNELISGKEIFFETFSGLPEFEFRFRRAITDYVQQLSDREKGVIEQVAITETPRKKDDDSQPNVATERITSEDTQFLHRFIAKTENVSGAEEITPFEVARFRLFGIVAAKPGNDEHTLGVHDANLIYSNATGTTFIPNEKDELIKSGLDNFSLENTPLWHWFREIDGFKKSLLPMYSLLGPPSVRTGALSAMTLIGQPITEISRLTRATYMESWFSEDREVSIKIAALSYLGLWGTESDLIQVKMELDRGDYQTRSAAADAFFRIIARNSRNRALEALNELQADSPGNPVVHEIFSVPSSLDVKVLLKAAKHGNADVRLFAMKILRERHELPAELSEELLQDTSPKIRMEALLDLRASGREFSDTEAKKILVKKSSRTGLLGALTDHDTEGEENFKQFQRQRLRQMPEDELNALIEAVAPFNEMEYLVRAESHYEKYEGALKAAVKNGFVDFFQRNLEIVAQRISKETLATLEGFADSFREALTRDGLIVIERRKNIKDLGLVREVLISGVVKWADTDAEYLSRFGEWQDIELLVQMVGKPDYRWANPFSVSHESRYNSAAKAIYKLSRGRLPEILAMSLKSDLMEKIISQASDKDFQKLDYVSLKPFLFSRTESLRKVVLLKTIRTRSRQKIQEILAAYLASDEQHYYNVTHWLDFGISAPRERVLLATSRLLSAYRQKRQ